MANTRRRTDGVDPLLIKVPREIRDGVNARGKAMRRRNIAFCFKGAGVGVRVNDVFAFQKVFGKLTTSLSESRELHSAVRQKQNASFLIEGILLQ
jgi:hypothetical protein